MTRAVRVAHRCRFLLLILGLLFELAGATWVVLPYVLDAFGIENEFYFGLVGTPLMTPEAGPFGYLALGLTVLGLLLLSQWAFLRPSRMLPIKLTLRGRPLLSATIVAATMLMILTLGAGSLVLELLGKWRPWVWPDKPVFDPSGINAVWAGMLAVWTVWAWLLLRYWRDGDRYSQLGRVVRALVAGSILEAIIAAPVQAFASRQDDCHCERGSYTTLVCAGAVLFWAFGPGIVLLFLREHYRRARLFPHCVGCGYDLRGGLQVCPECGRPTEKGKTDLVEVGPDHADPYV